MGDKWEGGVKNLKNWWRHLWMAGPLLMIDNKISSDEFIWEDTKWLLLA